MSWTDPQPWQLDAACHNRAPELWLERPETGQWADAEEALAVCARCPVRAECLLFALEHESLAPEHRGMTYRWGIYGGLTPEQRERISVRGWRPGDPFPKAPKSPAFLRRQAVALRDAGRSYQEIAEIQGCPEATVRSRVSAERRRGGAA